jgi:hypothetical protein
VAETAALAARGGVMVPDAHLPPEVETIRFLAPDADGELVVHEAVPPGGTIRLDFPPRRG